MILKVRSILSTGSHWLILDQVDEVLFVTNRCSYEQAISMAKDKPLRIFGKGPSYYLADIVRSGSSFRVAFDDIAFLCNDEGKEIEYLGGEKCLKECTCTSLSVL